MDIYTDLGAIGKRGSELLKLETELLQTSRPTVDINGQKAYLPDFYRQSLNEGTFTNLMNDPLARAKAQAELKLAGQSQVENVAFDVSQIPGSGDLNELQQQLGVSQRFITQARRGQAGTITGESGQTGELETESFNLRSSLSAEGEPTGTGMQYFDSERGVEVYAPPGKHFQFYAGGGVRLFDGSPPEGSTGAPASSLFTQAATNEGVPTPGFKEESLAIPAAEGKTIARTGKTFFDKDRGIDVQAEPGNILIEYTDGTIEQRPITDISKIGEAKERAAFGPSAEELGITRRTSIGAEGGGVGRAPYSAAEALARAETPEEMDRIIQEEGLASTEGMRYLGQEYNGKQAAQGNAFYRAKDGTVLERSDKLKPLAIQQTEQTLQSFNVPTANLSQQFEQNDLGTYVNLIKSLMTSMGVGDALTAQTYYNNELKALDTDFAEQLETINNNPWLSEADRSKRAVQAQEKYNTQRSQLVARAELALSFDREKRAQAQYITDTAITAYNSDREYNFNVLKFQADEAARQFDQSYKLQSLELDAEQLRQRTQQWEAEFMQDQQQFEANYSLDVARLNKPSSRSPYSSIKSAQGGLIDLSSGQWIVPPTPEVRTVDGSLVDIQTGETLVQGKEQKLQEFAAQVNATAPNLLTKDELRGKAAEYGLRATDEDVEAVINSYNAVSSIRRLLGF